MIRKRKGWKWERLAVSVRERDDYQCQLCGEFGNEVDHIVPLWNGGSMWDKGNLQVLCSGCHIEKTRREARERSPARFILGNEEWFQEWKRLRADG